MRWWTVSLHGDIPLAERQQITRMIKAMGGTCAYWRDQKDLHRAEIRLPEEADTSQLWVHVHHLVAPHNGRRVPSVRTVRGRVSA
jgi:hypothetical protein